MTRPHSTSPIMNKHLSSLLTKTTTAAVVAVGMATGAAQAFDINPRSTAPDYFQTALPTMAPFVGKEARKLDPNEINFRTLDESLLQMKYDHDVKVYFLGETAGGYRNRLDFATTGTTVTAQTKIFGDTSCSPSQRNTLVNFSGYCQNPNAAVAGRSAQDSPLNVGDWVSLGKFQAGTIFDFSLVSNWINGGISGRDVRTGKTVPGRFRANAKDNPDGKQHAMSYFYEDLLVLAFEDLWGGGDQDFNDTVFAIDFGRKNNREIAGVATPEPTAMLGLGLMVLGLAGSAKRRSRKSGVES